MDLRNVFEDRRTWRVVAVVLAVIIGIVLLVINQKNATDKLGPNLVLYQNQEHSFSFGYPENADLAEQVVPPVLARVILPTSYLDAAGKPQNYLIEVVLGTTELSLYNKEVVHDGQTYTLRLVGPSGEELSQNTKESLGAVRDSFRFTD